MGKKEGDAHDVIRYICVFCNGKNIFRAKCCYDGHEKRQQQQHLHVNNNNNNNTRDENIDETIAEESIIQNVHDVILKKGTVEYIVGGPFITRSIQGGNSSSAGNNTPPLIHLYAIDANNYLSENSSRSDSFNSDLYGFIKGIQTISKELNQNWNNYRREHSE